MTTSHRFHPSILREYDIRGIVGETLGVEDARAIGLSFGSLIKRDGGATVCVGYDGRLSSPQLKDALAQGLNEAGVDVLDVGCGPTPMLYYAAFTQDADGGIMVTGSHNPPSHNGFKMLMGKTSFFGGDIVRLGEIAGKGDYTQGQGTCRSIDIFEEYVANLAAAYKGGRDLKIAWDAGNGAAGDAMVRLCELISGTHILMNQEIDGSFPSHHPDPSVPENLADLKKMVLANGSDLGIAFDGDGDRIGVIDGEGEILWGDQLMVIWAKEVLEHLPGATIIADVKASQVFFDEIERMGGVPLMGKTGHSVIKSLMAKSKAPLAGEMSGHIFFADNYFGFDDALYAAVRILSIVSRSDQSLAQMRKALPKMVNTPELRFDCGDTRKFQVIEEVAARLQAAGADVNPIDGVRVKTADGWWLLRASNTQAVLVARCESADDEGLERLKSALSEQLRQSDIEAPEF